ncbi:helix-turn-helix domain-containing protein, partial [Clostridium perfringens]
ARNLILYNGYTISESAYKSGFNNLSYFSKTYKKYMGLLPSEEKIT